MPPRSCAAPPPPSRHTYAHTAQERENGFGNDNELANGRRPTADGGAVSRTKLPGGMVAEPSCATARGYYTGPSSAITI